MSFFMNSDIEAMIIYVIINLFSETDGKCSETLAKRRETAAKVKNIL